LIFGVLFALVPLFFSWVAREMRSQPNGLDVELANGELFLVTAGICGAAVPAAAAGSFNSPFRGRTLTTSAELAAPACSSSAKRSELGRRWRCSESQLVRCGVRFCFNIHGCVQAGERRRGSIIGRSV
jgi:hypothetical protein